MVEAQSQQASDHLASEARRWREAGLGGLALHGGGDIGEAELADQQPVEAGDADVPAGGGHRGHAEADGERAECLAHLAAGQQALAVEVAVLEGRQDAGVSDEALLVAIPRSAGRRRLRRSGDEEHGDRCAQERSHDHAVGRHRGKLEQ